MIRINLVAVERQKAKKPFVFDTAAKTSLACTGILVGTLAALGFWYMSMASQSVAVDAEIAQAQSEVLKLRGLLREVEVFEARRTQLQQRVTLIETLRKGQSEPVEILDHVSRSLPDMLWLTAFEQSNGALTIEGRSSTLIALSDFVTNLGNNPLLKKPIDIVNSQVETAATVAAVSTSTTPAPELIKFTVKAQLTNAAPAPTAGLTGAERAAAARAAAQSPAPPAAR